MAQLIFYFDRNFGKRFPQALEHARPPFKVEYHHSKTNNFHQRMPDDEWLEICGKNGWVAFSHDRKFHAIATEATAIKQHSVMCFYLPGASEDTWHKLTYLVRSYPKISEIVANERGPFIYQIHPNLKFERIALPL